MELLVDTREQHALSFSEIVGVTVKVEMLKVGDYTARYKDGLMDTAVVERKSVGDCFHSFSHEYENEKAKLLRARELGLTYIVAVESPAIELRKGHTYTKDGEVHEVRKSGIAMVRQLMTWQRKYGVQVWFCRDRKDMAFMIQEYFLAQERLLENKKATSSEAHG